LTDFDEISKNIDRKAYPVLGWGSGRIVYDLQNGYVVKAAKNKRGIEQNRAEHQIAGMDQYEVFAKITDNSEDFRYLIMEKAAHIRTFTEVWRFYKVRNHVQLFSLREFRDLSAKYDLLPADLRRRSSWGLVNGKPVIIDFGFTRKVRHFYMHGR
jgi:hypothetical protein